MQELRGPYTAHSSLAHEDAWVCCPQVIQWLRGARWWNASDLQDTTKPVWSMLTWLSLPVPQALPRTLCIVNASGCLMLAKGILQHRLLLHCQYEAP